MDWLWSLHYEFSVLVIAAIVVSLSLCCSFIPAKLLPAIFCIAIAPWCTASSQLMVSFATIPVKWKPDYYNFLSFYGGQRLATLDEYRYYNKNIAIKSMGATFTVAAFPPTSAAARQHSLWTYLQVQQWLGRDLPPAEWGWKYHNNSLIPIATELLAAPQKLMKVISCNCKAGCTSTLFGCRQAGMPCSAMCSKCMGIGYSNTPQAEDWLCHWWRWAVM